MSNSPPDTEADLIEPIHPGAILMDDVSIGFGITQVWVAVSIMHPGRSTVGSRHDEPHR